jgi:hypothetical protein
MRFAAEDSWLRAVQKTGRENGDGRGAFAALRIAAEKKKSDISNP